MCSTLVTTDKAYIIRSRIVDFPDPDSPTNIIPWWVFWMSINCNALLMNFSSNWTPFFVKYISSAAINLDLSSTLPTTFAKYLFLNFSKTISSSLINLGKIVSTILCTTNSCSKAKDSLALALVDFLLAWPHLTNVFFNALKPKS